MRRINSGIKVPALDRILVWHSGGAPFQVRHASMVLMGDAALARFPICLFGIVLKGIGGATSYILEMIARA